MNIEMANRLANLRKEKGLSQEQLAHELGVSRQTVSKWETGATSPDSNNLTCLAKIYGITLDELLGNEKSEDKLVEEENKQVEETKENNDNNMQKDFIARQRKVRKIAIIVAVAYLVLVTTVYLLLGFLTKDGWKLGWLVYLLLPVIGSVFEAIKTKRLCAFAMPILITGIYVFIGLYLGMWHPTWAIFFFIPLYYGICGPIDLAIQKRALAHGKNKVKDDNECC